MLLRFRTARRKIYRISTTSKHLSENRLVQINRQVQIHSQLPGAIMTSPRYTGTEGLRHLEYPRTLGCSVPSVARVLLRARGYSRSRRSRRLQYLTDLDYSNAQVYVYCNQCRYNYPLRKRSFCVATGSYWRVFKCKRTGRGGFRGGGPGGPDPPFPI